MESDVYQKIHDLQKNDWWFGNARNNIVGSLLRNTVKDFQQCELLDVGCSEGAFLDYLKKLEINFSGIDINKNALQFCQQRGYGSQVKYGDIFQIPFDDESFDVVTLLDIVEHVDQGERALREVFRVCKRQGIVLLIVPAYQWLWSRNDVLYHHKKRYSKKEIQTLVKKAGFDVEFLSYFNMFLFPVFAAAVLLSKIFHESFCSVTLKPVPKPINGLLFKIMDMENYLLAKKGFSLPFGSSIIVIGRKK